ncbi:hypothetical protein R3W88_031997 [Solanum pinnatisectum]|uniref:RING-type E3 ubiquitin transferase n=1 Tax=Solanum pinnatisectum TaxID=50273 RepID=A0AAV9LQJ4_9SOLN|nr:hypothetical protein R3W88_031997 [Solanum pinnatisectum]
MGTSKQRWRISFHKSQLKHPPIPIEFICPISGSLMADPIIVSSGRTFERNCVHACKSLCFTPILPDASLPNFSTIIPNGALKSTIINWCSSSHIHPPQPIDFISAQNLVRTLMATQIPQKFRQQIHNNGNSDVMNRFIESVTQLNRDDVSTSSEESGDGPLPQPTRPLCYSSSSSSELDPNSCEEDEIIVKLKSSLVFKQEEAVISLHKLTRTREETRFQLCTPRLLSALRSIITSRYASVQVNSVAALVNLSLENQNKVKIVRSGIIPTVIDVLKGGFPESQEHAAGALFSLALDDQNKTAIGVLGALPPLLHSLPLFHLSMVQSNRAKLIKLGAVQSLLSMVRTGPVTSRILLILCNMAGSLVGRGAMLDGDAVECFVGMLRRGEEFDTELIRESCVSVLYGLSHSGLRFKGLAKEAVAENLLMTTLEEMTSERGEE